MQEKRQKTTHHTLATVYRVCSQSSRFSQDKEIDANKNKAQNSEGSVQSAMVVHSAGC